MSDPGITVRPGAHRIDARGTRCPVPVLRAARFARTAASGEVVVVLADDPAAVADVPAWARLKGHDVMSVSVDSDGGSVVVLRLR